MSAFQTKIYTLNIKHSEAQSRVTVWKTEAQFKCRSFHIPKLILPIKNMKTSTFESVKSNMSNLGQPMNVMNNLKFEWPKREFRMWATSFQTSNVSCPEPNAYIKVVTLIYFDWWRIVDHCITGPQAQCVSLIINTCSFILSNLKWQWLY